MPFFRAAGRCGRASAGELRHPPVRLERLDPAGDAGERVAVVSAIGADIDGGAAGRYDVAQDGELGLHLAGFLGDLVRVVEPARQQMLEPIVDGQAHGAQEFFAVAL
jgi:hypothetical protein